MKNTVNAKDAMEPARTPTQSAHVSAFLAALANKAFSVMMPVNALRPANAPPKFNQNHSNNVKKMKNSVNAKVATARAKTPTPCARVSADLDALA